MVGPEQLISRLAALIERQSPRRVIVVVRHAVSARWLASLLAERGVLVGARILDLEGLLRTAATELAGEAEPPLKSLARVRAALLDDPQGRFAAIAEQPSYQREVLRCFIELERALEADVTGLAELIARCPADTRDRAMLDAFERFRGAADSSEIVGAPTNSGAPWWPGRSLGLVLAGHRRVSFLRRRAAAIAIGFPDSTLTRWEQRLLEALGFERWASATTSTERHPLDLRLSCAGPEAEIAAVARLLREQPEIPSVVLAPASSIPRWAARLGHRDVPVRAWIDRRAADTTTARTVRALLRILATPQQVRRGDLEQVLFGAALRVWSCVSESLALDYPREPSPADLRDVWELQRSSAFGLDGLADRIRKSAQTSVEALNQRAARFGWPAAQLDHRRMRAETAHTVVATAIDTLAELGREFDPASLRTLVDDWALLERAAIHGTESASMSAARVIVELLAKASPTATVDELAADLEHALARASVGRWQQTRPIAGGPAVWLLPYASAAELGELPERVILTGLDRHPASPVHHGPISESLRASLGLLLDATRFTFELRELDAIVVRAASPGSVPRSLVSAVRRSVIASWRHRDGAGGRRPPGPWIAGRQAEGRERRVGVDVIAVPMHEALGSSSGVRPTSPLERALLDWAKQPELERRVEAIKSHDAIAIGPHTGALGVAVPADRPYSASALQSYAALPYRYFVERVIGLRERERPAESASALLATEQGKVVHHALETAVVARLADAGGPIELAAIADPLLDELLEAVGAGYRNQAEHGRAEAIWTSERDRWTTELQIWWAHWRTRLTESGVSTSKRKPEPDVLVPGPTLVAAEWSPSDQPEQPFMLDLAVCRVPFVAQIDRIELDVARQRINICDYKTGRPSWQSAITEQLRAGLHLQLPLYARVVHQVLQTEPERLRLAHAWPVGALRLEYLQRPHPNTPGRVVKPQARGFAPSSPLGVDVRGVVWTIEQAAAGFTIAFVGAIEAGWFAVAERASTYRRGRGDRMHELARVVPDAEHRATGLPAPLRPLPDLDANREVVK